MAHAGSVAHSTQSLGNGQKLSPVRQKEGSLFLHWLYERMKQQYQVPSLKIKKIQIVKAEHSPLTTPNYNEIDLLWKSKEKPSIKISEDERLLRKRFILFELILPLLQERLSHLDNLLSSYQGHPIGLKMGQVKEAIFYFTAVPNDGVLSGRPGSCGFISLGTDRDTLMKDLSSALHDNAEIRNLIGQQIYNDYRNYQMARDELKMEKSTIDKDPRYAMSLEKNDWSRLEVAIQASDQAERARNNLVTDLRAIYSINIQVGMEELIAILRSLDKSGEARLRPYKKWMKNVKELNQSWILC